MNERTDGWMDMDGWMDVGKDGWREEERDGWMDGGRDGGRNEGMDGCMDSNQYDLYISIFMKLLVNFINLVFS